MLVKIYTLFFLVNLLKLIHCFGYLYLLSWSTTYFTYSFCCSFFKTNVIHHLNKKKLVHQKKNKVDIVRIQINNFIIIKLN